MQQDHASYSPQALRQSESRPDAPRGRTSRQNRSGRSAREDMLRAQETFYDRNDITGLRPEGDDRYRLSDEELTGRQPNYRGRGPKGYQRADERILEEVCERLMEDPYLDASDIDVTCAEGEVTLEGRVDRRSSKRYAEQLVERCSGVRDVHNRLTVVR